MKIGIIGSGQIGGTLTRRLSALGHKVFVANSRGPESLKDLAAETGAKPVSVREAARSGELVVVTIPEKNISSLPADLFAGVLVGCRRGGYRQLLSPAARWPHRWDRGRPGRRAAGWSRSSAGLS